MTERTEQLRKDFEAATSRIVSDFLEEYRAGLRAYDRAIAEYLEQLAAARKARPQRS